jgi:hypothetical protein
METGDFLFNLNLNVYLNITLLQYVACILSFLSQHLSYCTCFFFSFCFFLHGSTLQFFHPAMRIAYYNRACVSKVIALAVSKSRKICTNTLYYLFITEKIKSIPLFDHRDIL